MRIADRTSTRTRVAAALTAALVTSAVLPRAASAQGAAPAGSAGATSPAPPPSAPASDDAASTEETVGVVLLVSAGAALAAGIGLGVASVIEHRRSRDLLQDAAEEEQELVLTQSAYADAIAARDDLRVASGIAAGAGLALFLAAGTLFAIDEARDDDAAPATASPPPRAVAVPVLGPGHLGASATLRF